MDTKTLLLTATATETLLALAMVFFQATRKTYPGFERWVATSVAMGVGYLLMGLRGPVPEPISIFFGNLAFFLAGVWRLSGTRRFLGRPNISWGWYAFPAVALTGLAVFYFGWDLILWRTFIIAVTVAGLAWATACVFLGQTSLRQHLLDLIIALLLGVLGLMILGWAAALPFLLPQYHVLVNHPIQAVFLVAVSLIHIGLNLAFIMLNSQRLELELVEAETRLKGTVAELKQALAEVKTLGGLLPICANCKKIRDDQGYWQRIETYLTDHTEARFTHGLCPDCIKTLYPDYYSGEDNTNSLSKK